MDDTVRLREVQKNIADFKKEEAVINEKLSTLNRDDLSEKDSLLVKHRKLSNEKAKTDGILDELHVSFLSLFF